MSKSFVWHLEAFQASAPYVGSFGVNKQPKLLYCCFRKPNMPGIVETHIKPFDAINGSTEFSRASRTPKNESLHKRKVGIGAM